MVSKGSGEVGRRGKSSAVLDHLCKMMVGEGRMSTSVNGKQHNTVLVRVRRHTVPDTTFEGREMCEHERRSLHRINKVSYLLPPRAND